MNILQEHVQLKISLFKKEDWKLLDNGFKEEVCNFN